MRQLLMPTLLVLAVISLCLPVSVIAANSQLAGIVVRSIIDNPNDVIDPPDVPPGGTEQPTVPITGTSKPNSQVKVFNNQHLVAQGESDANGDFNITTPLSEGENKITTQTPDGSRSNTVEITRHPSSWWYKNRWYLAGSGILLLLGSITYLLAGAPGSGWLMGRKKVYYADEDDDEKTN